MCIRISQNLHTAECKTNTIEAAQKYKNLVLCKIANIHQKAFQRIIQANPDVNLLAKEQQTCAY